MDEALQAPLMADQRWLAVTQAISQATPALRSFVRRRVRNLADAEDIVQDALLALATAYGLSEPIERIAGWLTSVARRRIIDRYRAQKRTAQRFVDVTPDAEADEPDRVLDRWAAPAADGPEGMLLRERVLEEIESALHALPPEQRDVFVAHEFEGRSFKSLSTETGTPVNTLLGRKHAAVRALRERLEGIQSLLDGLEIDP